MVKENVLFHCCVRFNFGLSIKLTHTDDSPPGSVNAAEIALNGGVRSSVRHDGQCGSLSFVVPACGVYRLSVWIGGGWVREGRRGPAQTWNSAKSVGVTNADLTGIEFRLPAEPASCCH